MRCVDVAGGLLVSRCRVVLLLRAGRLHLGLVPEAHRSGSDSGSARLLILRGALFVNALLRFALLALALFAALFGFHHVLAQFAIGAEQAAVGYNEFRFLFFFRHKFF